MTVGIVLMVCKLLHAKVELLRGMYSLLLGVELTQKRNASELE